MLRPGLIVMEIDFVAVRCAGVVESVTVNERLAVPGTVGVPLITPPLFMVRPVGSPVTAQVYGEVPPVACIVAEYVPPPMPFGSDVVLTLGAGLMVREMVAVAVWCVGLVLSVTEKTTLEVP